MFKQKRESTREGGNESNDFNAPTIDCSLKATGLADDSVEIDNDFTELDDSVEIDNDFTEEDISIGSTLDCFELEREAEAEDYC